jgi:hypothetical protein
MNSVGNINEDLIKTLFISCQIWSMLKQSILILILLFYHFNNNRNKYRWNNVIISQIGQGHLFIIRAALGRKGKAHAALC